METIEHVIDGCECTGKRCKDCQRVKCVGAFGRIRKWLRTRCRVCYGAYLKEYHQMNREKASVRGQKRYQENREEILKQQREHKKMHPEKIKIKSQRYYQQNADRLKIKAQVQKAHRRAKQYQAPGSFTIQEWLDLKVIYNHTCLRCGKQEPEVVITIDHVIPMSKGGSNDIANIQPLCLDCNTNKKRSESTDYRVTWQDSQKAG